MDIDEDDSKPAAIEPNDSRKSPTQEGHDDVPPESGEIPFLVTHWLDGLTADTNQRGAADNAAAIQSIRRATATLASAFETLGLFGQRLGISSGNSSAGTSKPSNKCYADMKRSWAAACPPNHLERLLESVKNADETLSVAAATNAPTNAEKRCGEIIIEQRRQSPGRTLNDAIDVELNDSAPIDAHNSLSRVQLALQRPPLVIPPSETNTTGSGLNYSSLKVLRKASAESKRKYLDILEQSRKERAKIRTHEKSLEYQNLVLVSLQENSQTLGSSEAALADDIEASKHNCRRVIAQIERMLPSLLETYQQTVKERDRLERESRKDSERLKVALASFRDPISQKSDYKGNLRLHGVISQQLKGSVSKVNIRKSLLYNRFAHVGTINTHLTYPVFCLKFDKTGRYFITGADDYLVKIFCLASAVHRLVDKEPIRGAVLVCTLKGHAGVINDIQVSSDNCFVATASEDGDVRVWGLHNGCPIAILRGHVGGANMVSWSSSTPYHLVTTGADGLARVWDIRLACLKRYKRFVGKRIEYSNTTPSTRIESTDASTSLEGEGVQPESSAHGTDTQLVSLNDEIPLPPLPLAPGAPVPGNGLQRNQEAGNDSGNFVSNDRIDDGVRLVVKLQHGSPPEAREANVPGTRSRLSSVKVICVARCPKGGHFATGSDDGICRVWYDIRDGPVLRLDQSRNIFGLKTTEGANDSMNLRVLEGAPLLNLKGHLSAITDLEYSKQGDRLMTASQKDGVVRIWSWNIDPGVEEQSTSPGETIRKRVISHILIKLTNPKSKVNVPNNGPRPRMRAQTTDISCDVARWLSDDLRIVTSQCEYTRQNASTIVPGSQFLFIWDSFKGHCLMCIDNPHRMQCPLVLPHPHITSIMCSAGADGWMKVWDLEQSECLFSFENIAEYGPFDPNDRGKSVGFLDGDFSPDGVDLVLTDDSGRVVVYTSNGHNSASVFPGWAREQYFSNDYYDLVYDTTGYCVERGSETPPHLAPKGSRCTHSGSPFSTQVNETLKNLHGPSPLGGMSSAWFRIQRYTELEQLRSKVYRINGNIVSQFDPAITIMVCSNNGKGLLTASTAFDNGNTTNTDQPRASNNNRRNLSSNYRWMDYEDLEHEAGNDDNEVVDPDDEEFDPSENRRTPSRVREMANDSASEDDQLEGFEADTNDDAPASRAPERRHTDHLEQDVSSEDTDEYVEYMSTNNTPSGPFVADYAIHLFKMPSQAQANNLNRRWLQRVESTSSYEGRRRYAPQLGDSVVYIPRAHYDTIARFPSLEAPWQNWPDDSSWPVVQCCVRNIRYRFPYIHYRDGCRSIVAKITLQLTGVPEESSALRQYGWPAASFQPPSIGHVFEISLFENDETDFVIPFGLYQARLNQLEQALVSGEPVAVDALYATENEDEEFLSYQGKVSETPHNRDDVVQPGLIGSGYQSVGIVWPDEPSVVDYFSPWELSVRSPESVVASPSRPRLDENGKRTVRDALNHLRSIPNIFECFGLPVSEAYSDYSCRIEIPMDLSLVADRIEADFYATKFSFVADIRQIVTNCIKYNGDDDQLSATAQHMLDETIRRVLAEDEILWFQEYDKPLPGSQPTGDLLHWEQHEESPDVESSAAATVQRRRTQGRLNHQSSLESLPQPYGSTRRSSRAIRPPRRLLDSQSSPSRQSSRRTAGRPQHARNTRAASRSVLEGPVRTLEELSSRNGANSRGRSAGYRGRMGRTTQANPFLRRSTRNPQDNQLRQSSRTGLRSSQPDSAAVHIRTSRMDPPSRVEANSGRQLDRRGRQENMRRVEEAPFADSDSSSEEAHSDDENSRNDGSAEANSDEFETHPSRQRQTRPQRRSNRMIEQNDLGNSSSEEHSEDAQSGNGDSSTAKSYESEPRRNRNRQKRPQRRSNKRIENQDHGISSGSDDSPKTRQSRSRITRGEKSSHKNSHAGSHMKSGRTKGMPQRSRVEDDHEQVSDEPESSEDGEEPSHASASEASSDMSDIVSESKGKELQRPARLPRKAPAVRKRRRQATDEEESPKRPRSRTRGVRATYEDPSSSDFDDKSDDASRRQRKPPATKKRKASNDDIRKRTSYIQKRMRHYGISRWPEIALGHITKVTNEVVERFKALDEEGIFHLPVAVAYPEIAQAYKKTVAFPMDFRTIVEDRVNLYQSIQELQDDLFLVFDNCIVFNEEGSQYHDTATTMIELLGSTFEGVCDDLKVRTLRHQ